MSYTGAPNSPFFTTGEAYNYTFNPNDSLANDSYYYTNLDDALTVCQNTTYDVSNNSICIGVIQTNKYDRYLDDMIPVYIPYSMDPVYDTNVQQVNVYQLNSGYNQNPSVIGTSGLNAVQTAVYNYQLNPYATTNYPLQYCANTLGYFTDGSSESGYYDTYGCACPPPYNWYEISGGEYQCVPPFGAAITDPTTLPVSWGNIPDSQLNCDMSAQLLYTLDNMTNPGGIWSCSNY